MRRIFLIAALLGVSSLAPPTLPLALAHEDHSDRTMHFPALQNGGEILAVDLHTHSVFSDGSVWPDIRVQEAQRDGLAAFAVTEHLEYQPHAEDIPHRNRNRSFEIAREQAADTVMVFNGSEITREMPPGHLNAVFLQDANRLLRRDAEAAIREANRQGAFVFWNHPYWTAQRPDGIALLEPMHERLIAERQLHGIEVANGADFSEAALRIALDHNLAILGTSDIHGLVDWDYDNARGDHRTVTLVLSQANTDQAIHDALNARRTVAWYRHNLIGRTGEIEEVVRACLRLEVLGLVEESTLVRAKIINSSPVRFTLRVSAPTTLYNSTDLVVVPARGEVEVHVSGGVDPATLALAVDVLNTITAPNEHLGLTLNQRQGPDAQ